MRKVRNTLPIVLPALAILALLAAAGHAGKPAPEPWPVPTEVSVTGGLDGTGNPKAIRIKFIDSSFGYPENSSFISHQYRVPSLTISGAGMNSKVLTYFYCTHASHVESALICDNSDHDLAGNWYCLQVAGGIEQKKSPTGEVVFPVGSPWRRIQTAEGGGGEAHGTLGAKVTYDVITP